NGEGKVCLWEVATGKLVRTLTGRGSAVRGVVFSPDGRSLLAMSCQRGIQLWEVATGGERLRLELEDLPCPVEAVPFAPDGRAVAWGGKGVSLQLRDSGTGEPLRLFPGHGPVGALAFTPDGRKLASGGEDTTILIWDVPSSAREVARRPVAPLSGGEVQAL